MINHEHVRTLQMVKKLAQGETVKIDGFTIGMGEDMSIGAIMTDSDGKQFIGGLSTMDLAQFNALLTKHNVGMVISNTK